MMKKPLEDGWTTDDVEKVIERGIPEELLYVPIFVSMNPPDCQWAEDVCLRLSSHQDVTVRGNAILGFGHLARTCGRLNKEIIKPLIEEALRDSEKYVRGQAVCAAEDTRDFLGWNYSQLEL